VRIYAFHCGGDRSPRAIYDPFDEDPGTLVYGPYFFFLVDHPSGRVLFDSGVHPKWAETKGDAGGIAVEVDETDLVVPKLATIGLKPDDISHVVASHLHFDHAGGLQFFPHARIYVGEKELPFAYCPAVYQRDFYDRDDFDHSFDWVLVRDRYDLFGDGTVVIVPAPGHTPGHQALLVELESGLHVLAADASYWSPKMRARRLPAILWSPDAMVETWEKLEDLERLRGARLIFSHDTDFREAKPLAPGAWYE
jgi:glyoxylase-like metal-dependent hydrolase (beta-lactamase superfamily II)